MIRRRPAILVWCILSAAIFLSGCSESYRAETVLHSDGTVERAIYQPVGETPDEAKEEGVWESTTFAGEISDDRWEGDIRSLPQATQSDDRNYFAGWGKFTSADELPAHFVEAAPSCNKKGELIRHHARVDYIFVTEHSWSETLTDVVTIDDMRRARKELAALIIPLVEGVLQEGLGEEYELAPLVDYLRTDGIAWFEDLTDAYLEIALRREMDNRSILEQRLSEVCNRYGLELKRASLESIGGQAFRQDVKEFLTRKLRELVRKRDGAAIDDDAIFQILWWLRLENVKDPDGKDLPAPFDAVAERVIDQQHGSNEVFEKKVEVLLVRILGVYGAKLLGPEKAFHYQMTMPGVIVETSGQLLSNNQILWEFSASDAYPFGFPMSCKSLEANESAQEKLLGRFVLKDRRSMMEFVAIVAAHPDLRETLGECQRVKSLQPLSDYRRDAQSNDRDDQDVRSANALVMDKLFRLLELE